jgi:uncharacterized protein (DUF433 family)
MLLAGAKSRIVVDPKVMGGKPVIRGARMLVYFITVIQWVGCR